MIENILKAVKELRYDNSNKHKYTEQLKKIFGTAFKIIDNNFVDACC